MSRKTVLIVDDDTTLLDLLGYAADLELAKTLVDMGMPLAFSASEADSSGMAEIPPRLRLYIARTAQSLRSSGRAGNRSSSNGGRGHGYRRALSARGNARRPAIPLPHPRRGAGHNCLPGARGQPGGIFGDINRL